MLRVIYYIMRNGAQKMKRISLFKRGLSALLAGVMLVSGFVFAPAGALGYDVSESSLAEVSSSDWMSVILDGTKLTEITIPGTHDSCARKFKTNVFTEAAINAVSKCQSLNITEQLNAGIRWLDVRCEVDASTYSVKTVHGSTDCWNGDDYYYLDYVFQDVYNWLDAHPSETVLISIKEDDGDNGVPAFTNAIYEYIHGYGQGKYFYGESYNYSDRWYLGKSVPTLGEVRGKCVLFNRFDQYIGSESSQGVVVDEAESGQKIKYNEMTGDFAEPYYQNIYSNNTGIGTAHIQDYYKWTTEQKITATQYMLNLGHWRGEYYINYSSTVSDSTIPNPENLAGKVNPSYYTYTYTRNKPSGIYAMDFATADLARQIILNNEAVCARLTGIDGNISYTLNRKTGTLTVSGSGAMNDYAYTSDTGANGAGSTAPWGDQAKNCLFEGQYNSDLITSVIIEEGVTSIGNYAFYGYDHITSVSIPSTVTSIGEGAFTKCSSLTSVDISGGNIASIGYAAFKDCTSLAEFKTSDSVSAIGTSAFLNCPVLTMYGSTGIYSQEYANANSINYKATDVVTEDDVISATYSVNTAAGNGAEEAQNPFAGEDLSGGVTISFSKYCAEDGDWNGSLLNFNTGVSSDNRYFIIMANGTILFNDGNGGAGGWNNCYFDLNSNSQINCTGSHWDDIVISIYKDVNSNHILDYYINGALAAQYNLSSICASGYPVGVSGEDGIFSFLASDSIKLYYGAAANIYGTMGGTQESYLDNVAFYSKALSPLEIAGQDSALLYFQDFGTDLGGTAVTGTADGGKSVYLQTDSNDGRQNTAYFPYSKNGSDKRNYVKTSQSPFAGMDTSKGFTVSYYQRINGNYWDDTESVTFAQGETGECKYFTLGTDGYLRFNNGNGGSDSSLSSAGLYFDHTTANSAILKQQWQYITVSIIDDFNFVVYVNGVRTQTVNVSGTSQYQAQGGLMSFLASGSTQLYFGSYTPYWGTCTLSLDDVRCFSHALSDSEAAALYREEAEQTLTPDFENGFDYSVPETVTGYCKWAESYDGRSGVLCLAAGSATRGNEVDYYVNGVKASDLSALSYGSEVRAVYTGNGDIARWENTMVNPLATVQDGADNINEYTFTLTGNSTVSFIAAEEDADKTALQIAIERANSIEQALYTAESFAALQQSVENANAVMQAFATQQQADSAAAAVLTAISDLRAYLNLSVTAVNGSVSVFFGSESGAAGDYTAVFGNTVSLTAQAQEGYVFAGWYETVTKRIFSADSQYSFVITSNTSLQARFVPENSAQLIFKNDSGQIVKIIVKSTQEWADTESLATLLPAVPFKYGFSAGQWSYDEAQVLSSLGSGTDAVITPVYSQGESASPEIPQAQDVPVITLAYSYNSTENRGSFVMAAGLPQDCRVESIGTAFYYSNAEGYDPCATVLDLNNRLVTSKFDGVDDTGVYITNISSFSNYSAWAAVGYVTYYDSENVLRTAYSNQVNIVNCEKVAD